ncbi:hypothetical protein IMZ11_24630 [Microtetraspora sp. AC03309]|nr:hypothetical protein [Microtetraspora sp. AC03309]
MVAALLLAGASSATGASTQATGAERPAPHLAARAPRCPSGNCDVGGTGNSFAPNTLVLGADGRHRPIGELRGGDRVAGRDGAQPVLAPIRGTGVKDLVEITADGVMVTATAGHLFWVQGQGWTPATELRPGHRLSSGLVVMAVRRVTRSATVYNLYVAGTHTYMIQIGHHDVLVHS